MPLVSWSKPAGKRERRIGEKVELGEGPGLPLARRFWQLMFDAQLFAVSSVRLDGRQVELCRLGRENQNRGAVRTECRLVEK